jgi:hypothetical protein
MLWNWVPHVIKATCMLIRLVHVTLIGAGVRCMKIMVQNSHSFSIDVHHLCSEFRNRGMTYTTRSSNDPGSERGLGRIPDASSTRKDDEEKLRALGCRKVMNLHIHPIPKVRTSDFHSCRNRKYVFVSFRMAVFRCSLIQL